MSTESWWRSLATDAELVKAVLAGERQRFALVVQRHQRDIYNLAYRSTSNRQDAEDVTQETFLRAFRFLANYDPNRSLRTWLYSIAVNICRDRARKKARRPKVLPLLETDVGSELGSVAARYESRSSSFGVSTVGRPAVPASLGSNRTVQPQQVVIDREMQQTVQGAVMELDPDYRLLVILFYMRGLPQAEIADIMGLPLSVVKNRLYRARRRLRATLGPAVVEGG